MDNGFFFQLPVFVIANNDPPNPEPEDYFPIACIKSVDGHAIVCIFTDVDLAERCLEQTSEFPDGCSVFHVDDPFQLIGLLNAAIEANCRSVAFDPPTERQIAGTLPIEDVVQFIKLAIHDQA